MRNSTLLISIALIVSTMSCTSSKELAKKSVFTFLLEGEQYQIISINTNSGEGTNYLAKLDDSTGNQLNLARDLDQDGTIDLVFKNNDFSLSKANRVYTDGINKAKNLGNYAERTPQRTFEFKDGLIWYTIKSYFYDNEAVSCLFLIHNKETNIESMFLDVNADGSLDSIEKGNMNLDEANIFYSKILNLGIKRKRIELRNDAYIVLETQPLLASTALDHKN